MSLLVLAGPSGSGKSTIGREAAALSGAAFVEADDHHSDEARDLMMRGVGLSDAERMPWVDRVADAVNACAARDVVLACSALNGTVRRRLEQRSTRRPRFVLLRVPPGVLADRLAGRGAHFAGPDLLDSQLGALDADGVETLDGTRPPGELARAVAGLLRGALPPGSPRSA